MKFLEKEELSHFKFQKEFLKPFQYILLHNSSTAIKDLVLRCISQMVQAKARNIKSGWTTLFSVLSAAAKDENETIVTMASDILKMMTSQSLTTELVISNTLTDYIGCWVEFAQNKTFGRISLYAVEALYALVPRLSDAFPPSTLSEEDLRRYWMPLFSGFHFILMSSDLESRTRFSLFSSFLL